MAEHDKTGDKKRRQKYDSYDQITDKNKILSQKNAPLSEIRSPRRTLVLSCSHCHWIVMTWKESSQEYRVFQVLTPFSLIRY